MNSIRIIVLLFAAGAAHCLLFASQSEKKRQKTAKVLKQIQAEQEETPQESPFAQLPVEIIQEIISKFNDPREIAKLAEVNSAFQELINDRRTFNYIIKRISEYLHISQPLTALLFGPNQAARWFKDVDAPYRTQLWEYAFFEAIAYLVKHGIDSLPAHTKEMIKNMGLFNKYSLKQKTCFRKKDGSFFIIRSATQNNDASSSIIGLKEDGTLDINFGNNGFFFVPAGYTIESIAFPVFDTMIGVLTSTIDQKTKKYINNILLISQSGSSDTPTKLLESNLTAFESQNAYFTEFKNGLFIITADPLHGLVGLSSSNALYFLLWRESSFYIIPLPVELNEIISKIINVQYMNESKIVLQVAAHSQDESIEPGIIIVDLTKNDYAHYKINQNDDPEMEEDALETQVIAIVHDNSISVVTINLNEPITIVDLDEEENYGHGDHLE